MSNSNKNKQLISGTIIYAIGNFGTKVLNFLIIPLYTYYLAPDAMGEYDLLITLVSLLIPILTVQIGDSVYRELISDRYIVSSRNAIINMAYKILISDILLTLIGSGVFYLFTRYKYIPYFIVIMAGNSLFSILQKTLRGFHRQKLFAISGLIYTIVFLTLNVLLICLLHLGIEGMLLSNSIAYFSGAIFILITEKQTRPSFAFGLKAPFLSSFQKQMLKYSIPLIPNQLNWWIMNSSDRFIIKLFLGNAANGIYAISYKFPTMLQSIFSLFTNAFQDISVGEENTTEAPKLSSIDMAQENSADNVSASFSQGQYYTQIFDQYSIFVLTTVIFAIPISKIYIRYFMDPAYHEAAYYIGFLYLGCVFQSFAAYYGVGYLKLKKTAGASSTSIYGALINIVVNIIFIRFLGLYAAAISTAIGFAVMWIIRVIQIGKKLEINLRISHLSFFCGMAILVATISTSSGVILDSILSTLGLVTFIIANKKLIKQLTGRIWK